MIANVTIDKVRELPIVEVLSHFVQVKRQGGGGSLQTVVKGNPLTIPLNG